MSSQPLFKHPRAIKSPKRPSGGSHELTPYKTHLLFRNTSEVNLSNLELKQKSNASNRDKITSPVFLRTDRANRMDELQVKERSSRNNGVFDTTPGSIRLPSLIPVKRVTSANPLNQLGLTDLTEKKLLRRRLNSEDEKSLISISKMEIIFGGRDKQDRKLGLNTEFQNPKNRWRDRQSQVIYDNTLSIQRKISGRKKSEDLGSRLRIRNVPQLIETRNRSENICPQQSSSQIISSAQGKVKANDPPIAQANLGLNRSSRLPRKDSENVFDIEQENTKGSSFNTDKGTKERRWMNQILDDSENNSNALKEIRSNDDESKLNHFLQDSRKRAKTGKIREKIDVEKDTSRRAIRKSRYVSLRKDSMIMEKSDFDNVSERLIFESHLGSVHLRIPQHLRIGSQISEESEANLDFEIENLDTWRGKTDESTGQASELHWQIRVLELLDQDKRIPRSRKQSEIILQEPSKSILICFIRQANLTAMI